MPRLTPEEYEAAWRARIKEPNLTKLQEEIIRPVDELKLLFQFKGTRPHVIKRNWNFAVAMLLSEVEDFSDGVKLSKVGETAHLCGKHGHFESHQIYCFFSRLRRYPQVTDRIQGMTEYVKELHPHECILDHVPLVAKRFHYRNAPWRTVAKKPVKQWSSSSDVKHICYPFTACAHSDSLVGRVHGMVPKGIPQEIRGDLCQDLMVAVLSGDLEVENVPDAIEKYLRAARKFLPSASRVLSLDAPLYGDTERTMHETIRG